MANQIEQFVPVVMSDGLNTAKAVSITGATTFSGAITSTGGASFTNSSGIIAVGDSGTGTIVSGSTTINAQRGVITTTALTTGSAAATQIDLKNSRISATSQVFASVYSGTSNTQGIPVISEVRVATAGSCSIYIANPINAAAPLNGSVVINFLVLS